MPYFEQFVFKAQQGGVSMSHCVCPFEFVVSLYINIHAEYFSLIFMHSFM